MNVIKATYFFLIASITSSAFGWTYTVHNSTPYHMIVSFIRIAGLFDNPVVMTPNSTSNVSSWVGPIDYCYSGFHLLLQPAPNQAVPQIVISGHPAAITAGKLPSVDALQQLQANVTKDAGIGALAGGILGGIAGGISGALIGSGAGPEGAGAIGALGTVLVGAVGAGVGSSIGSTIALIGSIKSITANEVAYTAPWVPIPGDACWSKTITLSYNKNSNQIVASIE